MQEHKSDDIEQQRRLATIESSIRTSLLNNQQEKNNSVCMFRIILGLSCVFLICVIIILILVIDKL